MKESTKEKYISFMEAFVEQEKKKTECPEINFT